MPTRRIAPPALPLLAWDEMRETEELRRERANLLARLEHSRRWRSHRHQSLLERLRIVTGLLLQAELDEQVAHRDRLLMRN